MMILIVVLLTAIVLTLSDMERSAYTREVERRDEEAHKASRDSIAKMK